MRWNKNKIAVLRNSALCPLLLLVFLLASSYKSQGAYDEWHPELSIPGSEADEELNNFSYYSDFSLSDEYRFPTLQEDSGKNTGILFPLEDATLISETDNAPNKATSEFLQPHLPSSGTVTPSTQLPGAAPVFNPHLTSPTNAVIPKTTNLPVTPNIQANPNLPNAANLNLANPANATIPNATLPLNPNPANLENPTNLDFTNPSDLTATPKGEVPKSILINFNNVSIIEFIRFISRISNKNFIFDDIDLDFNVTIVSEEPATIDNVMAALLQVLRVHDLSLVEQGNNILIHRNKGVTGISQVVAEGLPITSKMQHSEIITQVFRLNTLDADKAATIIQPLISDGALVEALRDTNQVIVTDIAENVAKIGQLLKSLDSPNSGLIIGQYVVVNALLDSLISLAEKVMEPIAEGKPLVFVAHAPSNSVFVVSTPFLVDRALAVLKNLDINAGVTRIFSGDSLRYSALTPEEQAALEAARLAGGAAGAGALPQGTLPMGTLESSSPWSKELPAGHIEKIKFFIHKLRYRKGDQIVDALGRVGASLQESSSANLDLISTIQSIQWLEASNSLVFTGTISAVAKVKELIDEIDTPLRQVFLEMLIMQMTLDDTLNFSVNWGSRFDNKGSTEGAQAFLSGTNTLSAALDSSIPGSTIDITGLARQAGFHLGIIGRNITHGGLSFDTVAALVTAFHNKDKVEILMNPKLLVEDNSTAEVFVGINTAFQISSITNDFGQIITNNFEFRDVGTLFRVTPLISNNDIVTLEIREEVSSIASVPSVTASLSSISPGPTTNISRTVTKVHVPNKYFLVMSGMIQDQYERERQQVPCLGGAPLIGALFSDKHLVDQKRNLMIFIRPQIIDSVDDIDFITRHEQDIYRNKNRSKKMWKYEVEEALDLLNIACPDVSLGDDEEFNP